MIGGDANWRREVAGALAAAGLEVASVPGDRAAGAMGEADLVVARADGSIGGDLLRRRVPTRASLVIEQPSSVAPWARIDRPHSNIVAWPRLGAATELVPVRSPDGRHLFAERRARRGGARGRVAGLALRLPWPHPAGRILLATDGGAGSALREVACQHAGRDELSGAEPWTLITPGFRASRHVVLLMGRRHVLKVARHAGDRSVEHEAQVLRAAAGRPGARVPDVIAVDDVGGHRVLVETRVPGRDLTPSRVRRAPEAYAGLVAAWLRQLSTGPAPMIESWRRQLVDEPIAELRALGSGAIEPALLQQADGLMGGLRSAPGLIRAIEHGDVGDPNLLVDADGRLGVIDWELGRTDGVALLDLLFALGYFAGASARARDAAEHAEAWERVVLRPGGWGHALLRREAAAIGLDALLIRPLLILCWVRQLARLAARVGGGPAAADTVRGHRHLAILRTSIERLT